MSGAEPRRVLVAVSGGIAAYKIPELVRALLRQGHRVRCVLTPEARHFVSPFVLQTLTGSPARSELFDAAEEGEIDHIALADWAELIVLAPATAHTLARVAHGLADDLLSTVLLASRAPLLAAPAMNVNMWSHPATQENLERLRQRGVRFVGPESGELACGWEGVGRMAEPADIAAAAGLALGRPSLKDRRVLVTAGGTVEPIDTVRSLHNRSSGRMGFAIAAEAARRGAEVVLVAGATALPGPAGVRRVDVGSALEMREAVFGELERARAGGTPLDVVIKAAAVADFRPARAETRKIKKESLGEGQGWSLELVPTPDILAELVAERSRRGEGRAPVIVGFAAESHDVLEAARRKLARKGCDLLVANDVSRADAGFEVETNAVSFVWPAGDVEELPLLPKERVASELFDRVEKLLEPRE